jgi:hypothetical protein
LGTPIAVGLNDVYGDPTSFVSSTGNIVDFHVTIKWDNIINNSTYENVTLPRYENVTVRVQALRANGFAPSFEVSMNTNTTYILTEDDLYQLWSSSPSNPITELQISAKTTENATTAAVTVFVWGSSN